MQIKFYNVKDKIIPYLGLTIIFKFVNILLFVHTNSPLDPAEVSLLHPTSRMMLLSLSNDLLLRFLNSGELSKFSLILLIEDIIPTGSLGKELLLGLPGCCSFFKELMLFLLLTFTIFWELLDCFGVTDLSFEE